MSNLRKRIPTSLPASWLQWMTLIALAGVISVSAPGCTTGVNPVTGNTRAVGYSWEEEVKLGEQADQQIQQQYGVYQDDALQRYVDRVAQDVLAVSHMRRADTAEKFRNTEFTFRVLDSEIINAFALPGGYVYVTRGLLAHLNNEAQLAVVLGHEIAHVAARHASQRAARQQLTQLGVLGAGVAGGLAFGGDAAQNIIGIGGQTAQLINLSYSRGAERESDRLGVEYATMAGYNASEGAAFFESLKRKQKQSGQSIPTWQSTHPDPGNREDNILQLSAEWDQRVDGPSSRVEQDAFYREIEDIVLGVNPRNGFTENDVFYHPDLRFQFPVPSGWKVQNQPRQVAVVSPEQDGYVIFGFAEEDTPSAAAAAFTGQEGLTVVERSSDNVNGLNAERVVVSGQTQQGQELRVLAYFIEYGDNVYRFYGVTTASTYGTYRPSFERTMEGFRRLTDQRILDIQPARLAIRPATRSLPFSSFVDESDLPDEMTALDLAIINQVDLDQTIDDGRSLKLPR